MSDAPTMLQIGYLTWNFGIRISSKLISDLFDIFQMKAFDLLVLAPVIIGTEELKIQLPGRNGEMFNLFLGLLNCFGYLV